MIPRNFRWCHYLVTKLSLWWYNHAECALNDWGNMPKSVGKCAYAQRDDACIIYDVTLTRVHTYTRAISPTARVCSRDGRNNIATYRGTIINCARIRITRVTQNFHSITPSIVLIIIINVVQLLTVSQCAIVFARVSSEKPISPNNKSDLLTLR